MGKLVRVRTPEATIMYRLLRWIADHARTHTLAALAAGALAAPAALAQAPPPDPAGDLLDQTRRLQQVAAQKVEADTRLALAEAARLVTTDRPQAVEKYKQLLALLKNDQSLTEERRATLIRVVQDRIRVTESSAPAADEATAKTAQDEAARQPATGQKAEDQAKVKQDITAVAALRKEGKIAEAQRQAQELLKNHPDNVAVQVLNGISVAADSANDLQAVRKQMEQGRVATMRDMERSLTMIPLNGDVEFPKDWKEKTERRRKAGLSEEEVRVLRALAKPIPVELKGSKLQDAIDYISTMSDRTIIIEKSALDENQISYDTPVSFHVRAPVATRTVLRSVLGQVGLTYVVRDNIILVTTQPRARDLMVTKSYYVGDLVAATGSFGGAPQWGIPLDQAQLAQNVAGVVEMLTSSIDPLSWQSKGGLGTVGFNIPTMSLIVRQSAEVHAMIRSGLGR
jgi:hypothetical protein